MQETNEGIVYFEQEDVKPICDKCKSAYYSDWSIQDCDYCLLPRILAKTEAYARYIDKVVAVREIQMEQSKERYDSI